MNLDILVSATNEVLGTKTPSTGELWKLCLVSCRALKLLGYDKDFFSALKQASSPEAVQHIHSVFTNLKEFDSFLKLERQLLIESGLNVSSANALIEHSRTLREQILAEKLNPEAIRVGLSKLQNEVCEAEEQLERAFEREQRADNFRSVLKRSAQALGGATLVVVNATAATTIGQPYALASVAFGGGFINVAIRGE